MGSFIICPLHDKIKEDKKDGECGTHGKDKKCRHVFGRPRSKETVSSRSSIKTDIKERDCEDVQIIHVTQNRSQ